MSTATSEYFAAPLEDNLFEWHFTVRGPEDTDFQGGIYHGRIIVPAEYPMKPPDIIFLTPNGRFEVGKKICLSITGYHQETWQPSWSIRTAVLAIIGFMPSPGQGTIGSLDYTPEERRALAVRSRDWRCPECGLVAELLLPPGQSVSSEQEIKEMEDIVQTLRFRSEEEVKKEKEAGQSSQHSDQPHPSVANHEDGSNTKADTAASVSSPTTPRPTEAVAEPRTLETTNNRRPAEGAGRVAVQSESEGGGGRVYDVLVMLLVAAIAALLYRRINLMGEEAAD